MRDVAKAYELRWSNFVARAGVEGGIPVTAEDLPVPDDKTLQSLVNHPDEDVRRELRARWDPVGRCTLTPRWPRVDPARSQRLKLNCDEALSYSAFNLKLRRYSPARFNSAFRTRMEPPELAKSLDIVVGQCRCVLPVFASTESDVVGVYDLLHPPVCDAL